MFSHDDSNLTQLSTENEIPRCGPFLWPRESALADLLLHLMLKKLKPQVFASLLSWGILLCCSFSHLDLILSVLGFYSFLGF